MPFISNVSLARFSLNSVVSSAVLETCTGAHPRCIHPVNEFKKRVSLSGHNRFRSEGSTKSSFIPFINCIGHMQHAHAEMRRTICTSVRSMSVKDSSSSAGQTKKESAGLSSGIPADAAFSLTVSVNVYLV